MLEKLKISGKNHHAEWLYANQIQTFLGGSKIED
jgi:hypothetical protein